MEAWRQAFASRISATICVRRAGMSLMYNIAKDRAMETVDDGRVCNGVVGQLLELWDKVSEG